MPDFQQTVIPGTFNRNRFQVSRTQKFGQQGRKTAVLRLVPRERIRIAPRRPEQNVIHPPFPQRSENLLRRIRNRREPPLLKMGCAQFHRPRKIKRPPIEQQQKTAPLRRFAPDVVEHGQKLRIPGPQLQKSGGLTARKFQRTPRQIIVPHLPIFKTHRRRQHDQPQRNRPPGTAKRQRRTQKEECEEIERQQKTALL